MPSKLPFEVVVEIHGPTVLRVCLAVVGAARRRRRVVGDLPVGDEGVPVAARRRQRRGMARDDRPSPSHRCRTRPLPSRRADRRHRRPRRPRPIGTEPDPDLVAALAALPDKQRQSVAYHYLAGLPYAEVAAILGGTAEAARRAAADGIASLRRSAVESEPFEQRKEHSDEHGSLTSPNALQRAVTVDPDHLRRLHDRLVVARRGRACRSMSPTAPSTARSAACCSPPPKPDW